MCSPTLITLRLLGICWRFQLWWKYPKLCRRIHYVKVNLVMLNHAPDSLTADILCTVKWTRGQPPCGNSSPALSVPLFSDAVPLFWNQTIVSGYPDSLWLCICSGARLLASIYYNPPLKLQRADFVSYQIHVIQCEICVFYNIPDVHKNTFRKAKIRVYTRAKRIILKIKACRSLLLEIRISCNSFHAFLHIPYF